MMSKPFSEDQARGMLVGLAVGDALGAGLAGQVRTDTPLVATMTGGGPHGLRPGQWTDETTQAMCLAQMLRSANGWDAEDAMKRLINWRDYGYLSPIRRCFDMDDTVADALRRFERTKNPYAGSPDETKTGSAGITRLAPVVLAYGAVTDSAMAVAQLQSRLTHASPVCQRAAASIARLLVTGDSALMPRPDTPPDAVTDNVMSVLQAAFWAFGQGDTFENVLAAAVTLGGDADRAGALTGQIAGRLFGYDAIPTSWRNCLYDHDKILTAADDLFAMRPIDI
ncbi:ADP-ribosylglycohydrolase family protein [Roseovarius aestuariivivens]|uniref:ADP-ribosylglycohydrolase family protein n=1 Tax=Roseovarius aestuariivivens TaxID=1888910 RepID=UPI00108196FC|nr:ADP-ribosylglycohydrolase family protein [Roseovarius aestuariivivens]